MKKVSTGAAKQIRNFSRQKLTILNLEREVAEKVPAPAETRTPSLPNRKDRSSPARSNFTHHMRHDCASICLNRSLLKVLEAIPHNPNESCRLTRRNPKRPSPTHYLLFHRNTVSTVFKSSALNR
jgi:hypothetical protein